jgi:hypothetical protein
VGFKIAGGSFADGAPMIVTGLFGQPVLIVNAGVTG